jgi:rfaE bifunctional protein kinase chain/domain
MKTQRPTVVTLADAETDLLGKFAFLRVLVAGDLMLDEYLWGEVRRVCPEAPVPIVEAEQRSGRPGGAGNAAANLAALGAAVDLCGVVGDDHPADALRAELEAASVGTGLLLADPGRRTTVKTRVMAQGQQVLRIDTEHRRPLAPELAEEFCARAEGCLTKVDALLLCDYGKGAVCATTAPRLIAAARALGKPVIVDPKGHDYIRYKGASLVKPNLQELEKFAGRPLADESDIASVGRRLAEEIGGAVLVSRGAGGMTLFRAGMLPWYQPAAGPKAVYDVTGAGDTVVALATLALAAGASWEEAVRLASLAAAVAVGKLGTAVVTPAELRDALQGAAAETSLEK